MVFVILVSDGRTRGSSSETSVRQLSSSVGRPKKQAASERSVRYSPVGRPMKNQRPIDVSDPGFPCSLFGMLRTSALIPPPCSACSFVTWSRVIRVAGPSWNVPMLS